MMCVYDWIVTVVTIVASCSAAGDAWRDLLITTDFVEILNFDTDTFIREYLASIFPVSPRPRV